MLADFVAAGDPLPVAALAAGLLPPVAEAAIAEAPWFEAVVETSRRLQEMGQPEWLDRARRLMRGVIERALAEERVSLLHLAARQIDALAPAKFTPEDERRGVQALLHAMSTMTYAQLDEWQSLSHRDPETGIPLRRRAPAASPAPPAPAAPPSPGPPVPDAAPSPPPAGPGPAASPTAPLQPAAGSAGAGWDAVATIPADDPLFAPAPPIVPPPAEPVRDPWPFAAGPIPARPTADDEARAPRPALAPAGDMPAGSAPAAKIPMPRVVMAQLPRGRPVPGWLAPEAPARPRLRPP